MNHKDIDWANYEHTGGRRITITRQFVAADDGQNILRNAKDGALPIYVRWQRSWWVRLFSWPWRPWQKYYGEPVAMRVTGQQTSEADGEVEVTWTLTEE